MMSILLIALFVFCLVLYTVASLFVLNVVCIIHDILCLIYSFAIYYVHLYTHTHRNVHQIIMYIVL